MGTRLQQAIDRLFTDDQFLELFRGDPKATLHRYRLEEAEIEAIKRGDAAELHRMGVDVKRYHTEPPAPARSVWLSSAVGRRALALLATMTLALGVSLATATPAHAARKRVARRIRARRLGIRVTTWVRRVRRTNDIRAGLSLRANVRHLGLRYVKENPVGEDPCKCELIGRD